MHVGSMIQHLTTFLEVCDKSGLYFPVRFNAHVVVVRGIVGDCGVGSDSVDRCGVVFESAALRSSGHKKLIYMQRVLSGAVWEIRVFLSIKHMRFPFAFNLWCGFWSIVSWIHWWEGEP